MKKAFLFAIVLLATASVFAQSYQTEGWSVNHTYVLDTIGGNDRYINAADSTPEYSNVCAVLLKGKEFNRVTGSACAVLAEYVHGIGWVAADRKLWKTPQISHSHWWNRSKRLDVTWWHPLPCTNLPGTY